MKSTVVAFSGPIASGKSSLSDALAKSLGCDRVSFGAHVRKRAQSLGKGENRDALQAIGEQLIEQDAEGFCRAVLADAKWEPGKPLIVDGVRHAEVAELLRKLVFPSAFRLVFVKTTREMRLDRLKIRSGSHQELKKCEKHSTEQQVETALAKLADITLDGNKPVDEIMEQLNGWARELL